MRETAQFVRDVESVGSSGVHVGLTEYDHSDVAVQVYPARLRAYESEIEP